MARFTVGRICVRGTMSVCAKLSATDRDTHAGIHIPRQHTRTPRKINTIVSDKNRMLWHSCTVVERIAWSARTIGVLMRIHRNIFNAR